MKKTLVAILALGGMAMATELSDATAKIAYGSKATTADITYTAGANHLYPFTLTVTLDADAFGAALIDCGENNRNYDIFSFDMTGVTNYTGMAIIYRTATATDSDLYFNVSQTPASSGTRGGFIGGSVAAETGDNGFTPSNDNWLNTQVASWGEGATAALTLTGGMADAGASGAPTSGLYLTINKADGSTIQYTASKNYYKFTGLTGFDSFAINPDLVTSAYFFSENVDAATAKALNAAAIKAAPEPATATLSLLALAGLAARRRRH